MHLLTKFDFKSRSIRGCNEALENGSVFSIKLRVGDKVKNQREAYDRKNLRFNYRSLADINPSFFVL